MAQVYILQQYEDGTYGYAYIDNLENEHGKVISEQDMLEEREDYINRCGLTFAKGQYGSNLTLDTKVNDLSDAKVRKEAAEAGYALDILINDEDASVRAVVAEQGYGLEKLVDDESCGVRLVVAQQGYGLEKLVNDKDEKVRLVVAQQGYGLETLIDDENRCVREAVARQGYGLEKLVNDEDPELRIMAVQKGVGLEKLVNDEDWRVRKAVAEQGYGLEQLVNDKDEDVRAAVASQGYGLETLIDDEYYTVREAVANQGYGLEKLVNDESKYVREAAHKAVVKFEREDIMLQGDPIYDCYDYIRYFMDKSDYKSIARILIIQINNNWGCSPRVYDLVNHIEALHSILTIYEDLTAVFDFAMSLDGLDEGEAEYDGRLEIYCYQRYIYDYVEMKITDNYHTVSDDEDPEVFYEDNPYWTEEIARFCVYSNKMTYTYNNDNYTCITFSNMKEFKAQLEKLYNSTPFKTVNKVIYYMLDSIDDYI